MCATNSIFGLKERINSSNSPQLSKDWRGEHKKREVVSRTRKKCYVFHRRFIPAIFKNRPTWQVANINCRIFFYQVSCFLLSTASTNISATHHNFFTMLFLNTLFNFLALSVRCSISMEFTWSNSTGPVSKLSANKQFISMAMMQVPPYQAPTPTWKDSFNTRYHEILGLQFARNGRQ